MNIIAIETSCEQASVALLHQGECLEERLVGQRNHSERLLTAVDTLLAEAEMVSAQLDAVAFGAGPGAFTGVRLACAVAQGLAMGAGLPVAAVDTLAALALQANAPLVLSVIDARMAECYANLYRCDSAGAQPLCETVCCAPAHDALSALLTESEHLAADVVGIGSGFSAYAEALEPWVAMHLSAVDRQAVPRARDVAQLAITLAKQQKLLPPEEALPVYVRNKVALTREEQQRQRQQRREH